jgi:prepilin-type N-terminal cleavage/methylation domain-containing protein
VLRFHRKSKGFTLIELMIVVAIIGILAAIAIPRFANLIDRAREARTQGNLGSIRSAMAICYGATDGTWPATIAALAVAAAPGPYLDAIPTVLLPAAMGHAETFAEVAVAGDDGLWFYNGAAAVGGVVNVNCTHIDSGGVDQVNTW